MNRKENRTALQAYTEPELIEIELSIENSILDVSTGVGTGGDADEEEG